MGARTELFVRKQAGGAFMVENEGKTTGNRFWVDSGSATGADSAGYGQNPDKPFLTLDYADTQCTANNGDIVRLMPGHAESFGTGAGFSLATAGVTVEGLGNGADRPTFTFAHTAAACTITGASITLKNVVLVAGIDSIVAPLTVSGADCLLEAVEWRDTTDIEFISGLITTAAADRLTIRDCFYNGYLSGNACTSGFWIVGANGLLIEDCRFFGVASTAFVDFEGTLSNKAVIRRCTFYNVARVALTNNIADTITQSKWVAEQCYDVETGTMFEGGSGTALAAVSYTAVTLADDSITAAKIAANAIGASEIADNAIDAGAIAAGAIDAATFAADALQAMQDEAEDALEGENLDHLAATTTAAADMTTEVTDGSVISRILSKTSDTSTYSPTTDALEMLSDKAGGFSGDGGAAQDDSAKASLDLLHTDVDAILADTGTDGVVLAAGAITLATFGANAIGAGVIADGTIDASAIASAAITADKIAEDAIAAAKIATGALTADAFAADAIVAATLATGALTADAFAANAIVAATLAADTLQAVQDEAEDALEGENLDHLAATAVVSGADMTAEVIDGSVLSNVLTKTGDTSNFVRATDSLEAIGENLVTVLTAQERAIEKSDGAVPLGDDDLFVVTGGPILVTEFVGIVTTTIGATISTCTIQEAVTEPAGDVALSTAVAITDDAAGTSYSFTAASPSVLTPTTAGAIPNVPRLGWLCPIGTIQATFSAADNGVIKWYMVYKPLSANSVVTAAA